MILPKIESVLTHTAVLVQSVDYFAEFFRSKGFAINAPEEFESEGTREIYVGDPKTHGSRLLLVEAKGAGPYRRALEKRGVGLHHIGLAVSDVGAFCNQLGAAGWLLHTYSLKSFVKQSQVYLVRPGIPLMLEVNDCLPKDDLPSLVTSVEIQLSENTSQLLSSINCVNAKISVGKKFGINTLENLFFDNFEAPLAGET